MCVLFFPFSLSFSFNPVFIRSVSLESGELVIDLQLASVQFDLRALNEDKVEINIDD